MDRYAWLEASRRLDWRFLLPEPELKRVAYGGERDHELLRALAAFGTPTVLNGADSTLGEGTNELVVLVAPTPKELTRAIRLLSAGGWLYLELQGAFSIGGRLRGRWRRTRAHLATLEVHGFDGVVVYWHWPTFATSKWIVPLGDPVAVRQALGRHQGSARTRLLDGLGRLLLRLRLLPRFAPSVSIVAHRPSGRPGRGM